MVTAELVSLLCCPACRGEIRVLEEQTSITCTQCQLEFQIKENIPIMIIQEPASSVAQEKTGV